MRQIVKFIACCAAFTLFGLGMAALSPQTLPEKSRFPLEEIEAAAADALQIFNVPGVAVGIVIDNQILLSQGYGVRNVDEDLPVTERTLFPIASCTKAFTALALGQLVDEGKVAWDDPVIKYIPEFRLFDQERTDQVTIRDLLTHRTGIPRHDTIWVFAEMNRKEEVIGRMPYFEPICGLCQEFHYNNLMYTIAGIVIERITGQSWEEVIVDQVFRKLEMGDSNTSLSELQDNKDFSLPYAEIDGVIKRVPFLNPAVVNPAGGINSNIIDMMKWARLQLSDGNLVRLQTLQELHAKQIFISDKEEDFDQYYGLGWFIGKYRGHDIISHGGGLDGFISEVILLPTEKLGIVILTNSCTGGQHVVSYLKNLIIDKFLGIDDIDRVAEMQKIRNEQKQELQEDLQETIRALNNNHRCLHPLEDYAGSYEHPSYGVIGMSIEEDDLVVSYGKVAMPLKYKGDDIFIGELPESMLYSAYPFLHFTFRKSIDGNIDQLEVSFADKPITFVKIYPS